MHHLKPFASITLLVVCLLMLLCTATNSSARGAGIRVGPAFNIKSDFRKDAGLMLGGDYFWVVRQQWLLGIGLKYIRFGPDTVETERAFSDFGSFHTREVTGGGSTQLSVMNFFRIRESDELDELSFITTFGLGATLLIQNDATAVSGSQKRTVEVKNVFALTGSVGSGFEWPIVDERIALTAEFEGMINFFVEDDYLLPAFYVSFGAEYRIAPW